MGSGSGTAREKGYERDLMNVNEGTCIIHGIRLAFSPTGRDGVAVSLTLSVLSGMVCFFTLFTVTMLLGI